MGAFVGEIRAVSFGFTPKNWAECNGQFLAISQYQKLYDVIGATYGGDNENVFALPDLRGRVPIHLSDEHPIGASGGEPEHALVEAEIPQHIHFLGATSDPALDSHPVGKRLAQTDFGNAYVGLASPTLVTMDPISVTNTGAGLAHNNMQPYLTLRFLIALRGDPPS